MNKNVDACFTDVKMLLNLRDNNTSEEFAKTTSIFGLSDTVKCVLAYCSGEMTLELILKRTRALLKTEYMIDTCCVSQSSKARNCNFDFKTERKSVSFECLWKDILVAVV